MKNGGPLMFIHRQRYLILLFILPLLQLTALAQHNQPPQPNEKKTNTHNINKKCFWDSVQATPPGAPGTLQSWPPAQKEAIGGSYQEYSRDRPPSPVWFSVSEGILSETYYPQVDHPQSIDFQFLVTDGKGFFSEQKEDTIYAVTYENNGMTARITGQDIQGRYRYEQKIITDPRYSVIRIFYRLEWLDPSTKPNVYVLFNPAIQNNAQDDRGYAHPYALIATDNTPSAPTIAIVPSQPFQQSSVGYVGCSDGWQDLTKNFKLTRNWHYADNGNIALIGKLQPSNISDPTRDYNQEFDIAFAFGKTADQAIHQADLSFSAPFDTVQNQYEETWKLFLSKLKNPEDSFFKKNTLAQRSAQIIKLHEDKLHPGGMIASLSKPGIPYYLNAPAENKGGYHLVWPRDLYFSALALLAAGDEETPQATFQFLLQNQKEDGSWNQNFWLDGTSYWTARQMDETAFPILLAYQLQKRKIHQLTEKEKEKIKLAAQFLIQYGPYTQQERWEENDGFSPHSIAAQIAALKAAYSLTGENSFIIKVMEWENNLERWTVTKTGPYGKDYYVRISPSGNPNGKEFIQISNGSELIVPVASVIDGGFIELVKLGIRNPFNYFIEQTLNAYDDPKNGVALNGIKELQGATAYHRYNYDRYGPSQVGGFWPILAAERGHLAIMRKNFSKAQNQLKMVERSALPTGLIPEQVILPPYPLRIGKAVPTPLVWSHAEHLILLRSLQDQEYFGKP